MRASDLPTRYNAAEILERNARERPEKVALASAERESTFRECSEESSRVAGALARAGVRPGEPVAILVLDRVEWATAFFGALKLGAVAAGLNTLMRPGELRAIAEDARARVWVVDEAVLDVFEEVRDEVSGIELVVVVGRPRRAGDRAFAEWIAREAPRFEPLATHRDELCSLNYSSGTTGEPKGILHAHKDYPLSAQLWGVNVLGLTEADRTFAAAKLFFTFGLGGNLIFPWYAGASAVLFSGAPRVAGDVLATIGRFRPTVLYHAPTGYASMLALDGFPNGADLSSLRVCVSAAEALPAPVWERWREATGLEIIDGIGSTENFHIFLSNRPGDVRPGSSGRPFDGYELRLVDDEGNEVPPREVGSLWVRGETASLGYRNRYEASRRTFRGEWLVTGDKYRIDEDGYWWHAGRSDDMLKVGGIWVSPVEVESALVAHPAVVECAVVARADDDGLVKPKAFVCLREGLEASPALERELVAHCVERMAAYKRPRWIEFVPELPKTATGKIQRFRLRG